MKKILRKIGMFSLAALTCLMAFATSVPAQAASVSQLREKVVSVAANEVGYYPSKDNVTKYGDWYGNQGAWCTTFFIWCFDQSDKALGTKMYKNIVPSGGSCESMKSWFVGKGTYKSRASGYVPQPGDMLILDADGNGTTEHVGIVESSNGSTVNTIEGNVAKKNGISGVARRSYSISDKKIMGYGAPNFSAYGSGEDSSPAPVPPPSNNAVAPPTDPDIAVEAYQATVNTGNLNVRNAPSADASIVKQIKSGTVVTVTATNGDWSKIQDGYVKTQYLTKVSVPVARSAVEAKSVRLSAETDNLTVGQSVVLNAQIKPAGATGTLTYAVNNENITVDQSGNVTAVSPGEATVTVSIPETSVSTKYTFYVTGEDETEAANQEAGVQSETEAETQSTAVEESETRNTSAEPTVEETQKRNAILQAMEAEEMLAAQQKDKKQTTAFIGTGVGAVGVASVVPALLKKKKSEKTDDGDNE